VAHPFHEAHPLTFEIDLVSQNLYCDACNARPLSAAWRCLSCNFELCSQCFGPVPDMKSVPTPTPVVTVTSPVVTPIPVPTPTPVVVIATPVVATPVVEPPVVVVASPTVVLPVTTPSSVIVVPGVMSPPTSTSVNRSKLHREHDLTWYDNQQGHICDGCRKPLASAWVCKTCAFDICAVCFTGTKLPPAVLATMMSVTSPVVATPPTPVTVRVPSIPVVETKKRPEVQFVAYVNLLADSEVGTNSTSNASVLLMNSGNDAWPHGCRLVYTKGVIEPTIAAPLSLTESSFSWSLPVLPTGAGEMVELTWPVTFGNTIGRQTGEYTLQTSDGTPFAGTGSSIIITVKAVTMYSIDVTEVGCIGTPLMNATQRYTWRVTNRGRHPLSGCHMVLRRGDCRLSVLNDDIKGDHLILPTIDIGAILTLSVLIQLPSVSGHHISVFELLHTNGTVPFDTPMTLTVDATIAALPVVAPIVIQPTITKDDWLDQASKFLGDATTRREVGRIMAAMAAAAMTK
jgi:hypothetical protein